MTSRGNGYLASPSMQTSIANQEVVEKSPSNWFSGYKLYKFSFVNTQECSVRINSTTTALLRAGQGFEMQRGDAPITSFIIVEAGIQFNFVGAY